MHKVELYLLIVWIYGLQTTQVLIFVRTDN